MITRVELKWWKSHEHSIFEFSRGTNVLVGINGSGKTSVMQAISFALFWRDTGAEEQENKD